MLTPPIEDRLREIVEQAQDLIYSCDAEGRFTYVNPAARLILHYQPEELIGRPFLSILREDYRETASTLLAKQFRERIPNIYVELAAVAKTGETIWIGQHVQLVVEGDVDSGHPRHRPGYLT